MIIKLIMRFALFSLIVIGHMPAQNLDIVRVKATLPADSYIISGLNDAAPLDFVTVPLFSTPAVNTRHLTPIKITDSGYILLTNTLLKTTYPTITSIPKECGYRWHNFNYQPLFHSKSQGFYHYQDLYDEFYIYEAGHASVTDINERGDVVGSIGTDFNWHVPNGQPYFRNPTLWPTGESDYNLLPTGSLKKQRIAGPMAYFTNPSYSIGVSQTFREPDEVRTPKVDNSGVVYFNYSNAGYFIPGLSLPEGFDRDSYAGFMRTGAIPFAVVDHPMKQLNAVSSSNLVQATTEVLGVYFSIQFGALTINSTPAVVPIATGILSRGLISDSGLYLTASGWANASLVKEQSFSSDFKALAINGGGDILSKNAQGIYALYKWAHLPPELGEPENGFYQKREITLNLPTGWSLQSLVPAITNNQVLLGTMKPAPGAPAGLQSQVPAIFIPAGLFVDINRNGKIDPNSQEDRATPAKPFRFWSNDDDDALKTYTIGDTVVPNIAPPGFIGAVPLPVFYEQEQDDLAVTTAAEDWKDDSPDCARDLEDFARLQVYIGGLHEAVRSGQIIIGVKWGSMTRANPSIRLHRHAESTGGTGYLFNTAAVTAQLNLSANEGVVQVVEGTNYLVSGTDVVRLPSRWFSTLSEQNPRLNLLFEGGQDGTGELRLVLLKKEGESYVEIGEGPGFWLDIQKPNEFVERFSCGDDHLGDVVAVRRHSSSATFAAPTKDEEKDYVLYVHGYNMAEIEKQRWIETAYKRLYWLGYKGRVGGFSWPCAQSFPPFDASEENAWNSAVELKAHLANLKAQGYRVHVIAHSQGNVVMGEALRQWAAEGHKKADGSPDPLVRTYIASQAAVAASCYKENVPLMPDPGQETPDVYGTYPPTSLPYFDVSAMSGAASRYVNFYNPVDYALTSVGGLSLYSWETDQRLKPTAPYLYLVGFQKLTLLGGKTLLFPDDRFEIFSYAAEAKSKALGVMPTGGVFTSFTNLQSNQQYGPEHIYHSGQFRASMATRYRYWQGVMTAADLTPYNP